MIYSNVLVVHGPNLPLYKNTAGLPILDVDINPFLQGIRYDLEYIAERGIPLNVIRNYDLDLQIVQTNEITSVIDILSSNPEYYNAMIINVDYAHNKCRDLANTIELLKLPVIEVNTRKNKEGSQLRKVTKLEICGAFELTTYKLALTSLFINYIPDFITD